MRVDLNLAAVPELAKASDWQLNTLNDHRGGERAQILLGLGASAG
jgi:hypothetical protein